MKKLIFIAAFAGSVVAIRANTYTYTGPTSLHSLEHQDAYTWGLTTKAGLASDLANGMIITKAEFKISDIWDWQRETDKLFIDLLNNPKYSGVKSITDNSADNVISDYFTTASAATRTWSSMTPLTSWSDPHGGHSTGFSLVYDLDPTQITILTGYLTDAKTRYGRTTSVDFGFGLDPDCHYYDCGVTFTIDTGCRPPVPETGATLVLLALGLLALPGFKRLLRA